MVEATNDYLEQQTLTKPSIPVADMIELATKYGTPFYLIDQPTLINSLRELEDSFRGYSGLVRITYSMKANFNSIVVRTFIKENILFDITSLGELFFYLKCLGKPENIIYTSVTEEEEELAEVLSTGVDRIVVSSFNGLTNLINASESLGLAPSVMIRVNPEVGVRAEVKASYRQGKFGVTLSGTSPDTASTLLKEIMSSGLDFEGFHFHLGSQIENPICFVNALEKLEAFINRMRREYPDLDVKVLDIGGGTPVFYGSPIPTPGEMGSMICPALNSMIERLGTDTTVIVESGRFLSSPACILVSKIVNTKVHGFQKFIFVDAGYHLLLDAALLRQEYPQEVIPPSDQTDHYKLNLAGRLCDTYDIFPISPVSKLQGAEPGKFVVFRNVGAYSVVFNMPFHCMTKPPILARTSDGEYVLTRRRQTINELFEEEGGNLMIPASGIG